MLKCGMFLTGRIAAGTAEVDQFYKGAIAQRRAPLRTPSRESGIRTTILFQNLEILSLNN
jgi:hypothetical protein